MEKYEWKICMTSLFINISFKRRGFGPKKKMLSFFISSKLLEKSGSLQKKISMEELQNNVEIDI